jgi:predicted nucleic acid-binding Zn ribbon protein
MKDICLKKKKCKTCEIVFVPKNSLQQVCSYQCALILNKEKQAKEKKQLWTKEKKVIKEKLMTLSDYEREAKKSFQKWIRLRDKNLPCISCNNSKTTDWAGGHYFSAGMYSGLMFDERNCHKQCNTHCNKYLSGNLLEYRKGLINRYGIEFVESLESIADEKRNYKYTKEELIAKKLQYDIKIKELK